MHDAHTDAVKAARPAAEGRAVLLAVLLMAALVRGGVLLALFGQLQSDPDAYRQIANNVLQHGSFALDLPAAERAQPQAPPGIKPTAYRPPLYPCLLAAVSVGLEEVSPYRVALLHWLLGVATVGITYLVGQRLKLGWGAALAALFVACDPILLNQSALVMTETLATLLAAVAVYAWLRLLDRPGTAWAAVVGVIVGLAGLCRPTFLPWLAMLLVVLLFYVRRGPSKVGNLGARARLGFLIGVCALLVLSPWMARNYFVLGRPIITTTHGGYTLLLGNNPVYYRYLKDGDHSLPWPADDPQFQVILPQPAPPAANELEYDARTKRLAREAIQAQPTMFARASADRVLQLWNPLPHRTATTKSLAHDLLRYATCAWYLVVYGLAVVGLVKLGGRLLHLPWLAPLLLCVTFTLMHSVYWSNLRMRAPLMPVVALLAGAGFASLAVRQKLPVSSSDGESTSG